MIVVVSFDPREKSDLAAAKKASVLQRYRRPGADAGWHFLTGEQSSIESVTSASGFRYVWDASLKQFAHPTGIIVVSPAGRVSRYLFGIDFGPRDVRLAIVDASAGKIGSPIDSFLLYCYHYDPMTGRYGLVIMRVIRLAAAATVLALALFIGIMLRQDRFRHLPGTRHDAPGTSVNSTMWTGTPLFPQQASTMASRVDALYFFLVALTGFFSLLIAGLIVYYAINYRRRSPDAVGANIHGGLFARVDLDHHPARDHDGDLRVGRQRVLRHVAAARRNAEHLRRRQAVDVEVSAPRRPARDQRTARARRQSR